MFKHFAIQIFVYERKKINGDVQTESDDFYHELLIHQSSVSQDEKEFSCEKQRHESRFIQ